MKFNLTRPCKDCPFRLDAPQGWLGPTAQKIANELVKSDQTFPCHKTTGIETGEPHDPKHDSQCAGALLMLEQSKLLNNNWRFRVAQEWGLLDVTKLRHTVPVFSTPDAFVKHHCTNSIHEDDEQADSIRASGDSICELCGKPYKRHPFDMNQLFQGHPYLNIICDGTRVKL